MACCTDGDCPMHKSASREVGSRHSVSQAEADSCCAASERDNSAPSPSIFVLSVALAVIPGAFQLVIPDHATARDAWRTLVPFPSEHVPRHLLLSVLVV
jgi:hypothetical protein